MLKAVYFAKHNLVIEFQIYSLNIYLFFNLNYVMYIEEMLTTVFGKDLPPTPWFINIHNREEISLHDCDMNIPKYLMSLCLLKGGTIKQK